MIFAIGFPNLTIMIRIPLALLFLVMLFPMPELNAQDQEYSLARPNSASLMGWERNIRMQYLDRYNSALGPFTDRGVFQRYLRGMDDEYDLDIFTSRFSPVDDYLFFRSPGGFRTSVGVLNNERLLILSEMHNSIELAPQHRLDINMVQQEDANASRVFMDFGYMWNFSGEHHVGIQHNISREKVDVNASLFYQMGNIQDGMMRVTVTFPDYMNNLMFDRLTENVRFADSLRVYQNIPMMFSGAFITPDLSGFKAEAFFGYQPKTDAQFERRTIENREMIQSQWVNYMGGLMEYAHDFATLGVIYKREFTRTERDTVDGSSLSNLYYSRQADERIGIYLLAGSDQAQWESWLWFVDSYDKQDGETFSSSRTDSLNFSEKRVLLRNRFSYVPRHTGWIFSLEHALDSRNVEDDLDEMGFLAYQIHHLNSRVIGLAGYQFHPRAKVVVGLGLDVDGDFHIQPDGALYDNVFFRMEYRW